MPAVPAISAPAPAPWSTSAAIAATYFTLGLLMLLGVQSLWPSSGRSVSDPHRGLVVQSADGAALLAYALRSSKESSAPVAPPATEAWAALSSLA